MTLLIKNAVHLTLGITNSSSLGFQKKIISKPIVFVSITVTQLE